MITLFLTGNKIWVLLLLAILIISIGLPVFIFKRYIHYITAPRTIISKNVFNNILSFHFIGTLISSLLFSKIILKQTFIDELVKKNNIIIPITFLILLPFLSFFLGKTIDFIYSFFSKEFKNYIHTKKH